MQYPLNLSFKVLAFAPQIKITDATNAPVLFVRQKLFKLKEKIEVFSDETRETRLYTIAANKIIDFSGTYVFRDAQEQELGSVRRRGMRSLWRTHYEILGDNGEPEFEIREKNPWTKVADGLFGEIPVVGLLSGYVFNPTYLVRRPAEPEKTLIEVIKQPSMFESSFQIVQHEPLDIVDEYRVLLSLLMMVLLERNRG